MSRSYRIVRLATVVYDAVMEQLFAACPELEQASYQELRDEMFRRRIVYSDDFSRAMRGLGHDSRELITNLVPLQRRWAREHGIAEHGDWLTETMVAQLRAFAPEVIFVQGFISGPPDLWRRIKQEVPSLRVVVVFKGSPDQFRTSRFADVLFAGSPSLCRRYQQAGLRPRLLYHRFDPSVLAELSDLPREARGFVFAGSSGYDTGRVHRTRYWTLRALIERTPIELWIQDEITRASPSPHDWRHLARVAVGKGLRTLARRTPTAWLERALRVPVLPDELRTLLWDCADDRQQRRHPERWGKVPADQLPTDPLAQRYPDRCHPPVFGTTMYQLLHQSKLVFNRHTDLVTREAANMRLFEVTGVGSCLLTDAADNMRDLFEPDHEVVCYSSVEECVEKAQYLLAHDEARRSIAQAGQRRVLRDHTTEARVATIDEAIQQRLSR